MRSFRVIAGGGIAALLVALLVAFRGPALGWVRSLPFISPDGEVARLALENQELKAALARAVADPGRGVSRQESYVTVAVYSRYPFNDRDRVTIDRGERDGLPIDTPVFAAPDTLLGAVRDVRHSRSVVQTIFDPEWRSSVAIGVTKVKAVLEGGVPPRLELIPQESPVQAGDIVVNIDPVAPFGALIGVVGEVDPAVRNAWHSATVDVAYRIDALPSVLLPLKFP